MKKWTQTGRTMLVVTIAMWGYSAEAQETGNRSQLRWELVTSGATPEPGGDSTASKPIPDLTGTSGEVLFRLDLQPFLKESASTTRRLAIEAGVRQAERVLTVKADTANSKSAEALTNQGAVVTETSGESATKAQQRAITFAVDASLNRTRDADGEVGGAFAEFGALFRARIDAFIDDQRFFEKDGVTYVKVTSPSDTEAAVYSLDAGFRFKLSQFEEGESSTREGTGNVDDLLVFEALYRRTDARSGLLPDEKRENVFVARVYATPDINTKTNTKLLVGLEIKRDFRANSRTDVRAFYGLNVDLKTLFAGR